MKYEQMLFGEILNESLNNDNISLLCISSISTDCSGSISSIATCTVVSCFGICGCSITGCGCIACDIKFIRNTTYDVTNCSTKTVVEYI